MTFGDKLSKLRREQNYTQEQLADILGVSRQSVSKWESDAAYPETDKLVKMCELFNCSSDYLLLSDCDKIKSIAAAEKPPEDNSEITVPRVRERKSKKTLWGMPLWHVAKNARGIIAVGVKARGVVSVGVLSLGVISCGTLSLGLLFSVGFVSAALFSVGTLSVGLFAVGAISIGAFSLGAVAVGDISVGALSVGRYVAIGDNTRAAIAVGGRKATGEIFSHVGKMTEEVKVRVKLLIDENVPSYLNWAGKIIKAMLS